MCSSDLVIRRDCPLGDNMPLLRLLDERPLLGDSWRPAGVDSWTVRTRNVLGREFFNRPAGGCWADLLKLRPSDIMSFRNAGSKTVNDIVRMAVEVAGSIASGYLQVGDLVDVAENDGLHPKDEVVLRPMSVALPGLGIVSRWAAAVLDDATFGDAIRAALEPEAPVAVRTAANELLAIPISTICTNLQSPRNLLEQLRGQFEERDWMILEHRRLADPANARTLAEIADKLGLTRERVRQLQVKAFARLDRKSTRLNSSHTVI